MDSIIEENFYKYYVPFLKQYTCCTYLDYYRDTEISFLDFEDYEHLGESGAYKLTKKINEWIVWIMGGNVLYYLFLVDRGFVGCKNKSDNIV